MSQSVLHFGALCLAFPRTSRLLRRLLSYLHLMRVQLLRLRFGLLLLPAMVISLLFSFYLVKIELEIRTFGYATASSNNICIDDSACYQTVYMGC